MTSDDGEDRRFRAWFGELRQDDRRLAASFDRHWEAAQRRRADPRRPGDRPGPMAAALLVLVVLVGAAAWVAWPPARVTAPVARGTAPATSAPHGPADAPWPMSPWQSPTAFLLEPPADDDRPLPFVPSGWRGNF
jgi:hypothetical protein